MEGSKLYGLYDTTTNAWIGEETGPTVDSDKSLMEHLGRIIARKLGLNDTDIEVREYKTGNYTLKEIPQQEYFNERETMDILLGGYKEL